MQKSLMPWHETLLRDERVQQSFTVHDHFTAKEAVQCVFIDTTRISR